MGVRFFKSSFRKQGYTDKVFIPWRRRKDSKSRSIKFGQKRTTGRAILVQSGDLRRSINGQVNGNQIVFKSDLPYAQIHNDGGTINHPGGTAYRIVAKGKAVFISNAKRKALEADGKTVKVTKPHKIKIPRRRFMGPSAFLMDELNRMAEKRLLKLWERR